MSWWNHWQQNGGNSDVQRSYSNASHPEDVQMNQDDDSQEGRDAQQSRAEKQAQQKGPHTQASEQMLYDIYKKTMGMIEELEKKEEHGKSSREAKKPKDACQVETIIEEELVKLERQMKCAPPEAKQRAKERMIHTTKKWVDAQRGIPRGRVGEYTRCVFNILNEMPLSLPQKKKEPGLDGRTANDLMHKKAQDRNVQHGYPYDPSMPPYAVDTTMEDDPRASHSRGQFQALDQAQLQRFRTLQASEQMLYGIYEHTMGMIEELEKHEEHGKSVRNSGLLNHLPAYQTKSSREAKKPIDDVEAIIEAELVSLEAQMMFAPREAKQMAKEKMLHRTKMWAAAREERGIPQSRVDEYASNVVDILNGQPMSLPQRKKGPALDERTANDFMYKLAQARHQGELKDKEFHDDPKKKAVLRKMRQGEDESNGMRRLNNPRTQDMR